MHKMASCACSALPIGTFEEESKQKSGFRLPRAPMANADLARLINSDEVQSVVRPPVVGSHLRLPRHKNPLRNLSVMLRLNPYAQTLRRMDLRAQVCPVPPIRRTLLGCIPLTPFLKSWCPPFAHYSRGQYLLESLMLGRVLSEARMSSFRGACGISCPAPHAHCSTTCLAGREWAWGKSRCLESYDKPLLSLLVLMSISSARQQD